MDTPLGVLLAEDELGDILAVRRAFEKAGVKTPVHIARDGQEVVDYLTGNPPFSDPVAHPLPALLLLDLRLPVISGFELLEWLRKQPRLRHMIVVVFSSSEDPEDINRAYDLGANSYIIKPHDPDDLVMVVKQLQQYWLNINANPTTPTLRAIQSPTLQHAFPG